MIIEKFKSYQYLPNYHWLIILASISLFFAPKYSHADQPGLLVREVTCAPDEQNCAQTNTQLRAIRQRQIDEIRANGFPPAVANSPTSTEVERQCPAGQACAGATPGASGGTTGANDRDGFQKMQERINSKRNHCAAMTDTPPGNEKAACTREADQMERRLRSARENMQSCQSRCSGTGAALQNCRRRCQETAENSVDPEGESERRANREVMAVEDFSKDGLLSSNFVERCENACLTNNTSEFEKFSLDQDTTPLQACTEVLNGAPTPNCRTRCRNQCVDRFSQRQKVATANRSSTYTRDNDSCGDAEFLIAADEFAKDERLNLDENKRPVNREAFFNCLKGQTGLPPNKMSEAHCNRVKQSARFSAMKCNAQKTFNTALDITEQAAEMTLQAVAQANARAAADHTEDAAARAAKGENVSVQKEALTNAASTLKTTADLQTTHGALQMAFGITQFVNAQNQGSVADRLREIGRKDPEEGKGAAVGADIDGKVIRGGAMALIGSADGGAKSQDQVAGLANRGADEVNDAARKRSDMGRETLMKAMAFITKGAATFTQQQIYREQAAALEKKAEELRAANTQDQAPGNLAPYQPGTPDTTIMNSGAVARPGNAPEETIVAKAEDQPTNTPADTPMELPGPGGPGGAPTASIRDNPGEASGPVNGIGGGGGGGGGGASAGSTGDGGGESGSKDGGGERLASESALMKNAFQSAGGGGGGAGYTTAAGRGSKSDTGMDMNALLAQFLPKKDEDPNASGNGKTSILDYGQGAGARSPASQQQEDPSVQGPNSDLPSRITSVMHRRYLKGDLR